MPPDKEVHRLGIRGGRHIRPAKGKPIANLRIRLLDMAGVAADSIGDSTGKLEA